jgi:hypothetical protein
MSEKSRQDFSRQDFSKQLVKLFTQMTSSGILSFCGKAEQTP